MANDSLNVLPKQQPNTQNQTPNIPSPRIKLTTPQTAQERVVSYTLFAQEVPQDRIESAARLIDATIASNNTIKAGSFIIAILEKLGSIPYELSAEDEDERAQAVIQIEDLAIEQSALDDTEKAQVVALVDELELELNDFKDKDDTFNNSKFNELIIETIGRDTIATYPVIILLRNAIKRVRNSNKRLLEPQIITAQQIVILGIAKQLRTQN